MTTATKTDPTAAHTPLPWRVQPVQAGYLGSDEMRPAIQVFGPPLHPHGNGPDERTDIIFTAPTVRQTADLALIVRAVNAHAALVEALTEMREGMSSCMVIRTKRAGWDNLNGEDCDCWACNTARQAEAALTLAGAP